MNKYGFTSLDDFGNNVNYELNVLITKNQIPLKGSIFKIFFKEKLIKYIFNIYQNYIAQKVSSQAFQSIPLP